MNSFALVVIGLVIGLVPLVFLLLKRSGGAGSLGAINERLSSSEARVVLLEGEVSSLRAEKDRIALENATLQADLTNVRRAAQEKLDLLNDAQSKLGDTFKALSAEALKSNNQSFLELAKENLEKFQQSAKTDLTAKEEAIKNLVEPLTKSLEAVDKKIGEIEKDRVGAYEGLQEQVQNMARSQLQLQTETSNLVKALRAPQVRGRWGEIQLRKVVEMAGMVNRCDFREQESRNTEDGRLRPDLIVNLPSGKNIVIDAKCPLQGYLDALAATEEQDRLAHLKRHAAQVADHITKLGAKSYWDQFQPTPEFVVLFLPGETFFSAALEQDPSLIEAGCDQKVILATPTTLIALLRAVAYGWRQEQLAENAEKISQLGRELYDRVGTLAEHFSKMGVSLNTALGHYNKAVGSLETRVLVSARKFKELGASSQDNIESPAQIETVPRLLQIPESNQEISES